MRFLLFFLLASVLALAADRRPLLQQASEKEAERANPYDGQDAAARSGYKLFQKECAACHGPNGRGGRRAPGACVIRHSASFGWRNLLGFTKRVVKARDAVVFAPLGAATPANRHLPEDAEAVAPHVAGHFGIGLYLAIGSRSASS